jgi:hypothetical protein
MSPNTERLGTINLLVFRRHPRGTPAHGSASRMRLTLAFLSESWRCAGLFTPELIQLMRTLIPPERQAAVATSVVITARLAQPDAEGIHR